MCVYIYIHTHTHTHMHTHTHSLSLTHTHTHKYTHTLLPLIPCSLLPDPSLSCAVNMNRGSTPSTSTTPRPSGILSFSHSSMMHCVLQCGAVCCSVLQGVAVFHDAQPIAFGVSFHLNLQSQISLVSFQRNTATLQHCNIATLQTRPSELND